MLQCTFTWQLTLAEGRLFLMICGGISGSKPILLYDLGKRKGYRLWNFAFSVFMAFHLQIQFFVNCNIDEYTIWPEIRWNLVNMVNIVNIIPLYEMSPDISRRKTLYHQWDVVPRHSRCSSPVNIVIFRYIWPHYVLYNKVDVIFSCNNISSIHW